MLRDKLSSIGALNKALKSNEIFRAKDALLPCSNVRPAPLTRMHSSTSQAETEMSSYHFQPFDPNIEEDTIFALSSGGGGSAGGATAVSVIRLTGPRAHDALRALLVKPGQSLADVITAETPSQHDISTQRSTNPLFALLTGATFQPTAQDSIGLSSYLSNVASPHSQYNPRTQLPVMWTPGAPNYGFLVTKMQRCLDVVQTSWLGRTAEEEGTYRDDLRVMEGEAQDRGRYIDVDMSTMHGVERARDQKLVDSGLADIIISPFLPEILDLFTSSSGHHPRLMTILQDTKARIKASYIYLHGRGLFHGSYLEFISSEHILVNDYLVRMLSGKWDVSVELTHDDLHVAVQELQSKFHVGVQRHIRTYMEQMVRLLDWQLPHADVVDCMFPSKFDEAHQPAYPQPKPEETELEMQMREIVRNRNRWDVQLLDIFVKRWDEGVFAK